MRIFDIFYKERIHTVTRGETVEDIAEAYGTTVYNIGRANGGLRDFAAGEKLVIDNLDCRLHVAAPAETLTGIAVQFTVDPEALRRLNGIEGDSLYVGQRILIPNAERGAGEK